jgi:transposase-like protein
LTSRADHDAVKRDLKPIYTAPTPAAAAAAMDEFKDTWGGK